MNNRTTRIVSSLILAAGIIGGALVVTRGANNVSRSPVPAREATANAVYMEGALQVIEVTAKGGYRPNSIVARAGVPTVLRMRTQSTFDCSAAFVIPDLGIRKMLPPSGVTEFTIPAQKQGSELRGLCGMGMYSLVIAFN